MTGNSDFEADNGRAGYSPRPLPKLDVSGIDAAVNRAIDDIERQFAEASRPRPAAKGGVIVYALALLLAQFAFGRKDKGDPKRNAPKFPGTASP